MKETASRQAYLVGGGIASLATAVFLVRDGGFDGSSIRILEEGPSLGGALDGSGDPARGFVLPLFPRRIRQTSFGNSFDLKTLIS